MNRISMLEADLRRGSEALRSQRRTPAPRRVADPAAEAAPAPAPPPPPARRYPRTPRAAAPAVPDIVGTPAAHPGSVSASVARAMSVWSGRSAPVARAASRPRYGGRRPAVRAMALTLDHRVPNLPMPLKQASTMSCWATVATMMASWRDQASYGVPEYIASLGGPWAGILAANTGLSAADVPRFLATMGLQSEPAANFTAEAWEGKLRDYGPLLVILDPNPALGVQLAHATILVGIHGPSDGDPTVDLIDPAIGTETSMPLSAFVARYEQLAPTGFAGVQVLHWPAGAQRAAQQSLAWAEQAAARLARQHGGPAAAALAAAGLGWEVFKELVTEDNDLTWTRARLEGVRVPGDDESKKSLASKPFQKSRLRNRERLEYDFKVFSDWVGAEFEIEYQYNGNCIADVRIFNVSYAPPGPLSGRSLKVDTDITPAREHERGDVAAVQVTVIYSFSNVAGSQGTFVHRIVLFGDGRTPVQTRTES